MIVRVPISRLPHANGDFTSKRQPAFYYCFLLKKKEKEQTLESSLLLTMRVHCVKKKNFNETKKKMRDGRKNGKQDGYNSDSYS